MTVFIVDASVIAEYIIAGPYTSNARALFQGALHGDQFSAPELYLAECVNVIWKEVRFRGMPSNQAIQALHDVKALPIKRAPIKAVLDSALAVGLKYDLAIYDSLYIALAQKTNHVFVTIDGKQQRAAEAERITVNPITDFQQ
jgi:predicted nucleic acid-binding protein